MARERKGRKRRGEAESKSPAAGAESPAAGTETSAAGAGEGKAVGPARKSVPVVGLGASAGGLKALKAFFSEVPEDSGIAYVVVVHLTRKQPSMMADLLQRTARIHVSAAEDGQAVKPDHAYIIPPDKEIAIFKGKLQLLDIPAGRHHLPIDVFLRSLAQDQGSNAAAVILSGTGTDGTLGVREINSNDGLVLVQSEESADYDGMPRSAVGTGVVDHILPPEEMPQKIVDYFAHATRGRTQGSSLTRAAAEEPAAWLNKVYAILRSSLGYDFSAYKVNTIRRRINRRMSVNQIGSHDTYVRYLRENPDEVETLFRELLIGVTSFFRDAGSFDALREDALPGLFGQIPDGGTFRAWVPGCSTGEEVYSLAMVLHEYLSGVPGRVNLQLFGTDIDKVAIDKAREGSFPASISADVSEERLKRFFVKEEDRFRIRKEIRDCIVFSVQDVLGDPPFSHLSLLCCRNVLIYFGSDAQKRILPLFHYTLNPGGILMLGSSETVGGFTNLFESVDRKWRIFRRREVPPAFRKQLEFRGALSTTEAVRDATPPVPGATSTDIGQMAREAILEKFAPPAVLIDSDGNVLHVQGHVGKYLEPPSGPPTNNVLHLAREGLRIEISSALREAAASRMPVIRPGISVETDGETQSIELCVNPLHRPKALAGRFLMVFKDVDMPAVGSSAGSGSGGETVWVARIAEMEREMQLNRENHLTTVEELESSNEELKSTNEELQSSNEELQSTNEELESSREELQSLNEEMLTVNTELQSRLEELLAARDDMRNLLNSTKIATIFVNSDMRVRRFTTDATAIVNLIQTDIGRPLEHVMSNLTYGGMIADVREVLQSLMPMEREVQTGEGVWYSMHVVPYRTADNRIDGAVLTFSCIDSQKKTQEELQANVLEKETALELVRNVFDMMQDPLLVLNEESEVVIANTAFSEVMGMSREEVEGNDVFGLGGGVLRQEDLSGQLESTTGTGADFQVQAFALKTPAGERTYAIKGRIIRRHLGEPYRILLRFIGDI